MEVTVEWQGLLPALFPLCLLLWQELHREQESPQSLVTSVPLSKGWREPLARKQGPCVEKTLSACCPSPFLQKAT